MMNLVSVSCNHCGATLDFPEKTKFVTCSYCKSKLKVESTGSAFYTEEILEEIREVADDVETIKLQNKLERLDREWEMKRKNGMTRDKNGHEHAPPTNSALNVVFAIQIVIACIFILVSSGIILFATIMGAPLLMRCFMFIFPVFGVFFLFLIIANYKKIGKSAVAYHKMKSEYDLQRQAIVQELNKR